MELPEKIEEAIVAWLKTKTFPASFDTDFILPGESEAEITEQCILCVCGDAEEEMPQNSGNHLFPFTIQLQTPVQRQTDAEETAGDETQLEKHKSAADVLNTGVMVDDLIAQIHSAAAAKAVSDPATHADLANLTILGITDRLPQRGQENEVWISGFTLRIYAAGVAL